MRNRERTVSRKLWGGRFGKRTSKAIEAFTHSLPVDRRLARYDLLGSMAHAKMLGKQRIIPASDAQRLVQGLKRLLNDWDRGRLNLDASSEDVHTAIQLALEKKVGKVAERLHTARSRNDQVVTDLKLYCKEEAKALSDGIAQLQRAVLSQAERTKGLAMPGYTHLRHAQPVLVAHLLLSYVVALQRDRDRLREALNRWDELPLGSGALVGTGLPIDRLFVARALGFSRVSENSVDAVSDRDFVVDLLSMLSLLGTHLSRMAEDLILWSTEEFGFLRFDEGLLTGSSMMPQKQNPDFLELVRAGAARIAGNLSALLTLLKGLPSGYQRDLQGDKEMLFEGIDRAHGMLQVMTEGFQGIRWNPAALRRALQEDDALYATDLAEYLVTRGVPFAQAHRAVGRLLRYAQRVGARLPTLSLETLRRFSPAFQPDVSRYLDYDFSIRRKRSLGSTNPALVARAIRRWKKKGSDPSGPLLKTGRKS